MAIAGTIIECVRNKKPKPAEWDTNRNKDRAGRVSVHRGCRNFSILPGMPTDSARRRLKAAEALAEHGATEGEQSAAERRLEALERTSTEAWHAWRGPSRPRGHRSP
jgi:hypothetical protein